MQSAECRMQNENPVFHSAFCTLHSARGGEALPSVLRITPQNPDTLPSIRRSSAPTYLPVLRIEPDRMGIALARAADGVAHRFQMLHGLGVLAGTLEIRRVGEPRMMQPRRVHGGADVHVEVDHVDDDAQDRVDDRPAAGAAGDEDDLAVLGHDGRRLRRQHSFAGSDLVRPPCRCRRSASSRRGTS